MEGQFMQILIQSFKTKSQYFWHELGLNKKPGIW